MNRIPQILLLTLALTLIACGGDTVYIETPAPDPRPSLSAFHMVDSYDADTGLYHYPELYLNPYRYSGLFELYWYVERRRDYYAEFYVNYRPTINGALFIDEQLCGPGLPCDTYGSQICRYTADFTLSCSPDTAPLDIGHMVYELPQKLYLILQICDTGSFYCEYEYRTVWME
jgi:hypothetical protein